MNWKPDKLGAEPKKLAVLGVLVVIALVAYFLSRDSGDSSAPTRPTTAATRAVTASSGAVTRTVNRSTLRVSKGGVGSNPKEFKPSFKQVDFDPNSVDPTLHLSALARLQDVKVEPGSRSLFEIAAAPPPDVKLPSKEPEKVKPSFVSQGPMPPAPKVEPPTPKAPAIPLKFYGFVNPARPDVKRAFFLEGDDIVIAGEGDVIKKHYKIVRIGVNSAEVEDVQFKGDNTKQTLPLEIEGQG